jgi:hypothetical protein
MDTDTPHPNTARIHVQRQGFYNVRTAAHTAIKNYLELII